MFLDPNRRPTVAVLTTAASTLCRSAEGQRLNGDWIWWFLHCNKCRDHPVPCRNAFVEFSVWFRSFVKAAKNPPFGDRPLRSFFTWHWQPQRAGTSIIMFGASVSNCFWVSGTLWNVSGASGATGGVNRAKIKFLRKFKKSTNQFLTLSKFIETHGTTMAPETPSVRLARQIVPFGI